MLAGPAEAKRWLEAGGPEAGWRLRGAVRLSGRGETTTPYAIDRHGSTDGGALAGWPRARVGLVAEWPPKEAPGGFGWRFEYEHDLVTGALRDTAPAVPILGGPDSAPLAQQLRKAFLTFENLPFYRVNVGVMTSQWGLGLVANDGDHGWAPGSARFTDPRGGDRVARAQVSTAALGGWVASLAADWVLDDEVLLQGDELEAGQDDTAIQVVGAAVYGAGKPTTAGAYVVHRRQDAFDGRWLRATVIDLTAAHTRAFTGGELKLEAEATTIVGKTTFAGTVDHPVQDVQQFGAAARATLDFGRFGAVLDLLYATGDQNPDDASQNTFRADPNYEMGMVLFPHVLASQTGRGSETAGDPSLVGAPASGLERFPTRGSIGNAIVIFPRFNLRPTTGVEIYGGPLLALSEVAQLDPLNTRLAGGAARNALDGAPGRYLGTELVLGGRARFLVSGVELGLGVETGVLLQGAALAGPSSLPGRTFASRLLLDVRL